MSDELCQSYPEISKMNDEIVIPMINLNLI